MSLTFCHKAIEMSLSKDVYTFMEGVKFFTISLETQQYLHHHNFLMQ